MTQFYAVTSNQPNPDILSYLSDERISSIYFDETQTSYMCDSGKRGGLISALRKKYYPTYIRVRHKYSKKRIRKASSIEQGKLIDDELFHYIQTGEEPTDNMANALVVYFEQNLNHTLQATQLPLFVEVGGQERITQADLVTQDQKGKLWMWEIKSGYNRVQRQGYLRELKKVPNKDHEHWELQRHYTQLGLRQGGLNIYKSAVVNVFIQEDKIGIQKRPVPTWCKQI